MNGTKPRPTWKAWTVIEGETEMLYVKLDAGENSVTNGKRLHGDLGPSILEMIDDLKKFATERGMIV